jgi:ribosomal protein S18 acetylase RimI-like enzyme
MSTVPEYRRRGCATTILHTLASWGRENGAVNMYLQVMERNTNALNLYRKFGFERLYGYHYREKSVTDLA